MPEAEENSEKQKVVLGFKNLIICVCRGAGGREGESKHGKMAMQNKV